MFTLLVVSPFIAMFGWQAYEIYKSWKAGDFEADDANTRPF